MTFRSSRTSRLLVVLRAAIGLLVFVLAPRVALAQSITIYQKQSLPRVDGNGNAVNKRDASLNPEGINLQDCRDNQRISFPLQLAAYTGGDVIEVWATDAGGDCSQPTARSGGTQTCYRLSVDVPLTPTPVINIPVKSIIAGRDATQLDADGCRRLQGKTSIDVQFLFFRGGDTGTSTTKDDAPLNVKTQGPAALTGVTALPGDTRISITWDQIGEGGVSDVIGVRAYCDTAPTPAAGTATSTSTVCEAGVDEAGATFDAGCTQVTTGGTAAGAPIPTPSAGFSSNGVVCSDAKFAPVDGGRLIPGPALDPYDCGRLTGLSGNNIIASSVGGNPLPNGTMIAVAVAGIDSFNNVGELADAVCQFAETTTDFWRDYRDAGGQAGGGCAVAGPEAASSCVLGVAVVLVGSTLRRRRKRDHERSGR